MFHLKGVHHIALNCRDVVKVARFFKDILEVPIPEADIEEGAPIYFQIGTYTRIGLHPYAGDDGKNGIGQVDHISFSVTSRAELDYLVDKLEAENICYRGPITRPASFNLYFETPDGHHLEVRLDKDELDEQD
ncbi:VOC family protein [Brevibacillus composti]|uniref:VOC family protein n=1 Tax=Brevibacillus composti TaxID=2796470 RepID=A0A7T5EM85_9BACL|nr:VOC family protein [Brevibacillus composti]QQE75172.1 VOC family protein [Brevibacillus composti]QUO42260.1 VOC family protein [Brevibacillus composti]